MEHIKDFPLADILISFKSGHYKAFRGFWKGDSIWAHYQKESGQIVHVNKEEIEYVEVTPVNGQEEVKQCSKKK